MENNAIDISSSLQAKGVKQRGPVTAGRGMGKLMLAGVAPWALCFSPQNCQKGTLRVAPYAKTRYIFSNMLCCRQHRMCPLILAR